MGHDVKARPAIKHNHMIGIVICILVVMFALFFIGGPDHQSPRHSTALWNLGHILFFSLLTAHLFGHREWFAGRFQAQSLTALGICLVVGISVELLQSGLGRTPDAGDVVKDLIGGLVGIFFLLKTRKVLTAKVLAVFQAIVIGLVGLQIYPILTAFADEYLAREQFPVLAGFETPWELERWKGNASFAIDMDVHLGGKHSLRVQLGMDRYSGVHLEYFPGNWKGAKRFRCSVYNPSDQALFLTCRIHDKEHERGQQRYEDRFNRLYELPSGWSTIDIDVQDIRSAPKGRLMDMAHIAGVGLFAMNLPQTRVIFIDDVRLDY